MVEYKQLTLSDITAINDKIKELKVIEDKLKDLIKFGRQHGFWANLEDYMEARKVMFLYIEALRKYRKVYLRGLYKREGEYNKSATL